MLETAIVAARLAGQRAMEEINYIKVSVKNGRELVTQADSRCQQIIVERIKETYPDHGFIAEEGGEGKIFKQLPRGDEPIWWAIDPIDGTNNFAHRMPFFAISVAGEAQLNGRRIAASEEAMDKFSSVGLDSHFDDGVPAWACEIMRRTRFRNLGTTALHLTYVAQGSLVATIVSHPKLWDVAAGALIAETAGAIVSDRQGGKIFPVDLDTYEGQELEVMSANKKVHTELLQLLKS
jgi:myo-inositol-1(or 4)-monophosphatase